MMAYRARMSPSRLLGLLLIVAAIAVVIYVSLR